MLEKFHCKSEGIAIGIGMYLAPIIETPAISHVGKTRVGSRRAANRWLGKTKHLGGTGSTGIQRCKLRKN